jgi:hypothetical protein
MAPDNAHAVGDAGQHYSGTTRAPDNHDRRGLCAPLILHLSAPGSGLSDPLVAPKRPRSRGSGLDHRVEVLVESLLMACSPGIGSAARPNLAPDQALDVMIGARC